MSQYKKGQSRQQITFSCLDELVGADNIVWVIDAFVDYLDVTALGFHHTTLAKTGASVYHPALYLRIYLYGYLNGIRSSRKLERECELILK
jgi:transposase